MPKAAKPAKATTAKGKVSQTTSGIKSTKGSKAAVRLYSNFLPIALQIPSPVTIPSSSSRPLTSTTHYIYVRPHNPKGTDGTGADGRTVFVANLPVDITERDLRLIFGRWGVIESCEISGGQEGDVLERAVIKDLEDESDDDEDEDEYGVEGDGDGEGDGEEEQEGERAEPTFQSNTKPLPRKQRRKQKKRLPRTVPTVTPLPALNPRDTPFGFSGTRCAHITYLDTVSISRIMSHPTSSAISLEKYGTASPSGSEYYTSLHRTLRPSLGAIKEYSDTSMARFDHLHGMLLSSRAKKQGAGALVDEDGFTVVIRGGKYGRTGGRGPGVLGVGVAKKGFKGKEVEGKPVAKGAAELVDFYKFQKVDRKRQELADLRSKFEQDKAKVEEMKRTKRFKPY